MNLESLFVEVQTGEETISFHLFVAIFIEIMCLVRKKIFVHLQINRRVIIWVQIRIYAQVKVFVTSLGHGLFSHKISGLDIDAVMRIEVQRGDSRVKNSHPEL